MVMYYIDYDNLLPACRFFRLDKCGFDYFHNIRDSEILVLRGDLQALAKGEEDRKTLTNKVLELKGNLRVVCRVRPPMLSNGPSKMEFMKERELIGESITMYDGILTRKDEKYKFAKVCLLSFGQTGSEKTYSMLGKEGEHIGIIPRSLEKIFGDREKLKDFHDSECITGSIVPYGVHGVTKSFSMGGS